MASITVPHPVPPPLAELIAERFRAIGDPSRIRLLDALRDGPMTVGELQATLGSSQQNVSKHLGVLHRAGITGRERDGTRVRYFIADETVFDICELVCGGLRSRLEELGETLGSPTTTAV